MWSKLVRHAMTGARIVSYKIEWYSICHDASEDNDTSNRLGCQRERTAGEMPMSDLTNHTHGGNN